MYALKLDLIIEWISPKQVSSEAQFVCNPGTVQVPLLQIQYFKPFE